MEFDQAQLLTAITTLFNKHRIPYMITGAWSVIYYGRPRASHDIDFVVELFKKDVPKVHSAFTSLTPDFMYHMDDVKEAIKKHSMFQILYLPIMLKLDFWLLKNDPFDTSRFIRRKKIRLLDQEMTLASPEDTVLQKLRWYKEAKIEKHLVDAAFVYQIQKKRLDMKYLKQWTRSLKVTPFFNKLEKIDLEQYL